MLGMEEWKRNKLDEGWAGLILCMMWETAQGSTSRWAEYLGPHFSLQSITIFLIFVFSILRFSPNFV